MFARRSQLECLRDGEKCGESEKREIVAEYNEIGFFFIFGLQAIDIWYRLLFKR